MSGNSILDSELNSTSADILNKVNTENNFTGSSSSNIDDLGTDISFTAATIPVSFTQILNAPNQEADDIDNKFEKLNTYSSNLNTLITNETKRIGNLANLYKAYDTLNANITSPDGITETQKQILISHLNTDIQIAQSKQNLALAEAEQQLSRLNSDAIVANTVKTIRSNNAPVMSSYVKQYNIPKND